eukprot:SM000012S25281  [mRNA]  locus=s12:161576:166310:+ [translate_table: standard]
MADDSGGLLVQLAANSNSAHSLPQKLAKLEARMAGISQAGAGPLHAPVARAKQGKLSDAEEASSASSEADKDEIEFAVQLNGRKRKRSTQSSTGHEEALHPATMSSMGVVHNSGRQQHQDAVLPVAQELTTTSFTNGSLTAQYALLKVTLEETREAMKVELEKVSMQARGLEAVVQKLQQEAAAYTATIEKLQNEQKELKQLELIREQKRLSVLSELLIAVASAERQEAKTRLQADALRLGTIGIRRAGTVISEVWEDGQALSDIQARLRTVLEQKDALDRRRKLLKKKLTQETADAEAAEEAHALAEETFKARMLSLKREEELAMRDRERYEADKQCHIREAKRVRDEESSRYSHFGILHKRYALLNLLGKGGFSEVFKAFDLVEYKFVACKLHQLNQSWSEEKKQSYVRHAIREYNIHKQLSHPHIVRLLDIFEIDNDTFCTVLEYCSGKDLDVLLKSTLLLSEREARNIIIQIFQGLHYLNSPPNRVIHYDLKPGNILFDSAGEVKITDFGLSKIVEAEGSLQGIELTSQGAGTYWYLPPECFSVENTPIISSKVDVWSAGIILYQMLFGRRPFGHEQSQERILREETILNARRVEFPARPVVSAEAKAGTWKPYTPSHDFMKRCFTYHQKDRPDVLTVMQDPYLSYIKKK